MTADQELCLYCGEPLPVTGNGTKYCNNACKQGAWRYAVEQRSLVERFGRAEVTQDPPVTPSPTAPSPDHGPSGGVTAPPSRQW